MNIFENKLIVKEEVYENGFFPKVPKFKKHGSAIILSGGCNNDIIVDENTTSRDIRQGKYTQLIEVSTLPYIKEIRFHSPSKETHYSFDVYVKAVIQVYDPIVFYENKNIDVDAYFENLFSLDVKKITRKYSILDYEGMDDNLTRALSSYNTIDESTGFKYQISAVDAAPGDNAQEYVQKYGKQILDAKLKENARGLAENLTDSIVTAIMTEVAEGKLSEVDALKKIQAEKIWNFEETVNQLDRLRDKGLLTDKETRNFVVPALEEISTKKQMEYPEPRSELDQCAGMAEFYVEDEKK